MSSIPLGPLMLASERLAAVVCIAVFLFVAGRLARQTQARVDATAWRALLAGLVTARAAYVLLHFEAFRAEPWSVLAIWQGGFALWPGLMAGLAVVAVMLRRSRAAIVLGGTATALALFMELAMPMLRPAPRPFPTGLTLVTLDGRPVALDSLRDRPFVLNVWASWCGPCRREMPMVTDVARASAVPVFLANAGEDMDTIRHYLSEQGLPGDRVLADPTHDAVQALETQALPTTLFIDRSGTIVSSHVGEISRAGLTAQIEALERTPP
ncbi:prolipoprotein diacylglyceryl transferase family protein [Novosphingobium album (ex Hu et al. 2023)]|uniref:Redoxin family protein n=1 Tax=Novosphingobium album (ex Hu et al. 2023) TaxID=2930093 RepID=A0ABT0B604_9SPHN|nr:TlpA disulfide reductase family protein [Novosphingobium album (ex Hu et al. 2023)]MCJ2180501.1 redoxin family protein [Novosphingobium album (ex Hu et al. 2023)]